MHTRKHTNMAWEHGKLFPWRRIGGACDSMCSRTYSIYFHPLFTLITIVGNLALLPPPLCSGGGWKHHDDDDSQLSGFLHRTGRCQDDALRPLLDSAGMGDNVLLFLRHVCLCPDAI